MHSLLMLVMKFYSLLYSLAHNPYIFCKFIDQTELLIFTAPYKCMS